MLDDTGYFLPCETAAEAAALSSLCNDPAALGFLTSASFPDAKRPITKALLQRLDLRAILRHANRRGLLDRAGATLVSELAIAPDSTLRDQIEQVFDGLPA